MKITKEQYELIASLFPRQRGNVTLSNLDVINAILSALIVNSQATCNTSIPTSIYNAFSKRSIMFETFRTRLDILPAEWNVNKGLSKDKNVINKQIEQFKAETGRHYKNMLESKGYVTAEMQKNMLRESGVLRNKLTF